MILVLNTRVLGVNPPLVDGVFNCGDIDYPEHVIAGYELIDAVLPEGCAPSECEYVDGAVRRIVPPPPPEVVPSQVTRRQALQALFLVDVTEQMIIDTISANLVSPHKELALIEFKESQVFERNRPLVMSMGPLLGMTQKQMDDLFIAASKL